MQYWFMSCWPKFVTIAVHIWSCY